MTQVNLIIPYYRGSRHLRDLLRQLKITSSHVVFIDSAPEKQTEGQIAGAGFEYETISLADFDHGGTRNLGARLAREQGADILVFMTQDAIPANDHWLDELTAPILSGEAVATFARQLPRPGASLLEQFSRYFNYPDASRTRTQADIEQLGVKAFFFSNVCSAVRADVFWEVGGFPEHIILNEDMFLSAKILRAGFATRYVAEAQVVHSHNYSLRQQFQRNFDVGASFAEGGALLAGASVSGEGLRFVREQIRYVARHGQSRLLPLVILEAATKFIAFQLGKRHHLIPKALKKKLSMHSYHWDQPRPKENV